MTLQLRNRSDLSCDTIVLITNEWKDASVKEKGGDYSNNRLLNRFVRGPLLPEQYLEGIVHSAD